MPLSCLYAASILGLLWPSEIKSFYTFTNLNPWSQRFQCTELGVPVAGLPPHVLQEGAGDGDDGWKRSARIPLATATALVVTIVLMIPM